MVMSVAPIWPVAVTAPPAVSVRAALEVMVPAVSASPVRRLSGPAVVERLSATAMPLVADDRIKLPALPERVPTRRPALAPSVTAPPACS